MSATNNLKRVGGTVGIISLFSMCHEVGPILNSCSEASRIAEFHVPKLHAPEAHVPETHMPDFHVPESHVPFADNPVFLQWQKAYESATDSGTSKLVRDPPSFTEVLAHAKASYRSPSNDQTIAAYWDLAREKDPSRCVKRVIPMLIKPTNNGSYEKIFRRAPTTTQMYSALSATTGLSTERILGEITDDLSALESAIDKTEVGDLVVVVGHNVAREGYLPAIRLASGDVVTANQLRQIGNDKKRQIVIVCCWSEESGITGQISYAEGAGIAVKVDQLTRLNSNFGIHVGQVYSFLPGIYSSVVSGRNVKNGMIIVAVSGGTGWVGYEFTASPSGQQVTSVSSAS